MKRILLATNAAQAKLHALDFACFVAKATKSELTILFLESTRYEKVPVVKEVHSMPHVQTIIDNDLPENHELEDLYAHNRKLFSDACQSRGVNASVCAFRKLSLEKIILESRFADVLIADPDLSFSNNTESTPTVFIKELLLKSECPVILAPFSFDGVDEIVLAYDGSKSCVFAMRQFTHLFPAFSAKKIIVLQVNENESDNSVIHMEMIRKLLALHYVNVEFKTLHGQPGDELLLYLIGKRNTFVVMGAFGRNMLSNFFRKSMAERVLSMLNLPVLIAHR
ncbi:universal stress protein [Agriterribacter humi]|uniref:universal stress protein n=1 Tax=Agriterribacter humi TaxID=1104781 RepID=UPI0012643F46|nr:universal stress protein [Agriterribacter humi]